MAERGRGAGRVRVPEEGNQRGGTSSVQFVASAPGTPRARRTPGALAANCTVKVKLGWTQFGGYLNFAN